MGSGHGPAGGPSLVEPMDRHGDCLRCGVGGTGLTVLGVVLGHGQGEGTPGKARQGEARLTVLWGHGDVLLCTHLLHWSQVTRAFTEEEGSVPALPTQRGVHSPLPYYWRGPMCFSASFSMVQNPV